MMNNTMKKKPVRYFDSSHQRRHPLTHGAVVELNADETSSDPFLYCCFHSDQ